MRSGLVSNMVAMVAVQAVTVGLALALDSLGFPKEATIILFVLGVLATAVVTQGPHYSILASALSVVSFNFFIVDPRMSLRAWGPAYPATFVVMFAVALAATYMVARLRSMERASMEATIKARNEQMRADLLRSVSHDLRTPLTSIMGNADILLSSGDALGDDTRDALVQDIRDDALWLTDVVENLLAVTRFEERTVELSMRPEVVDDVIEEALRHVRRDPSDHSLTVVPSSELLLAKMDAQMIVQVIVNLVNNALVHTPAGCAITIATSREGDYVAVTVSDDGPGIPEGDKGRIFEAFYTSSEVLTDGRRGIGLGLALCKTIVEAHGGQIWVDDVEPHGAAFTFTLLSERVPDDV